MPLDQYALLQFALKAGLAVLVFLVGRWLARRARTALAATLAKTTLAPSMTRLILLATYYSILFLTIVLALGILGVPVTAVLSASLIVVVILGIALQQSIANLAATIVFMLFQPFRLGELIETNGVMGVVKELQFLSTVLGTADGKEITIPNAKIQDSNLINYTRLGRLRLDLAFNVSYADDIGKVRQVLGEILAADPRVVGEPAPVIFVKSLDDSGVTVVARCFAKPDDYWALQLDIPERAKLRFDAEGITIPFPQRDVRVSMVAAQGGS